MSKYVNIKADEKYKLWKEDKKNITSINRMNVDIVKNRDGVTGYVEMEYDKTKQIFKEYSPF